MSKNKTKKKNKNEKKSIKTSLISYEFSNLRATLKIEKQKTGTHIF